MALPFLQLLLKIPHNPSQEVFKAEIDSEANKKREQQKLQISTELKGIFTEGGAFR